MYKFIIEGIENTNQYEELIKVFLTQEEYVLISRDDMQSAQLQEEEQSAQPHILKKFFFEGDKDKLKREIYRFLEKETGKSPKWGILTGIRPVKLAGEMTDQLAHDEALRKFELVLIKKVR